MYLFNSIDTNREGAFNFDDPDLQQHHNGTKKTNQKIENLWSTPVEKH